MARGRTQNQLDLDKEILPHVKILKPKREADQSELTKTGETNSHEGGGGNHNFVVVNNE